jgi:hypothetical protein
MKGECSMEPFTACLNCGTSDPDIYRSGEAFCLGCIHEAEQNPAVMSVLGAKLVKMPTKVCDGCEREWALSAIRSIATYAGVRALCPGCCEWNRTWVHLAGIVESVLPARDEEQALSPAYWAEVTRDPQVDVEYVAWIDEQLYESRSEGFGEYDPYLDVPDGEYLVDLTDDMTSRLARPVVEDDIPF